MKLSGPAYRQADIPFLFPLFKGFPNFSNLKSVPAGRQVQLEI